MKLLFFYLSTISMLLSCMNQPNIDGLWYVESLNDGDENTPDYSSDHLYLSFEEDSVIIVRGPRRSKYEIDTSRFTISESIIVIRGYPYSYKIDKDSLVLEAQDTTNHRLVLKRINEDHKVNDVDPTILSGPFSLSTVDSNSFLRLDFLTDSTFQHESGILCSGYPFGKWSFFELNDFTFFDAHGFIPLLLVESFSGTEIILRNPFNRNEPYFLKKIDDTVNRQMLVGEWIEDDRVVFSELGLCKSTSNQKYRLSVSHDYLRLWPNGVEKKWALDFDERFIHFPNSRIDIEWELFELTANELKIGIYDTLSNRVDTVYFYKIEL